MVLKASTKHPLEKKRAAIDDYAKGMSSLEIAKKYKISNSLIFTWMKAAGVRSRSFGGKDKLKFLNLTPAEGDKAKPDSRIRDAILYLRHAKASMGDARSLSRANLMTLLALDELENM